MIHFETRRRKYLFYTVDHKGLEFLQPYIDKVKGVNASYELFFARETDLYKWLGAQKMGSYLYIAAPWSELHSLKRIAEDIGFSAEEAQYIGYGEKSENVFCCRCHAITPAASELREIECQHCQLQLEVSDHYSSLRDAYLGYAAKL